MHDSGLLAVGNSHKLTTTGARLISRCRAALSGSPLAPCSTPSCRSPSRAAQGAGCRPALAPAPPPLPPAAPLVANRGARPGQAIRWILPHNSTLRCLVCTGPPIAAFQTQQSNRCAPRYRRRKAPPRSFCIPRRHTVFTPTIGPAIVRNPPRTAGSASWPGSKATGSPRHGGCRGQSSRSGTEGAGLSVLRCYRRKHGRPQLEAVITAVLRSKLFQDPDALGGCRAALVPVADLLDNLFEKAVENSHNPEVLASAP